MRNDALDAESWSLQQHCDQLIRQVRRHISKQVAGIGHTQEQRVVSAQYATLSTTVRQQVFAETDFRLIFRNFSGIPRLRLGSNVADNPMQGCTPLPR